MNRLVGLLAVLLLVFGSAMAATPTCPTVIQQLSPCLGYLKDTQLNPSNDCCKGLKFLDSAAQDTAARRAVCACIKNAQASLGNIDYSRAAALPGKCGVKTKLPPITKNMDCSKIQ